MIVVDTSPKQIARCAEVEACVVRPLHRAAAIALVAWLTLFSAGLFTMRVEASETSGCVLVTARVGSHLEES